MEGGFGEVRKFNASLSISAAKGIVESLCIAMHVGAEDVGLMSASVSRR